VWLAAEAGARANAALWAARAERERALHHLVQVLEHAAHRVASSGTHPAAWPAGVDTNSTVPISANTTAPPGTRAWRVASAELGCRSSECASPGGPRQHGASPQAISGLVSTFDDASIPALTHETAQETATSASATRAPGPVG